MATTHTFGHPGARVECGSSVAERARARVVHIMRAMEEWDALFLWESSTDPATRPPASQYPLTLVLARGDDGGQVPGAMGEDAIAALRHYVRRILPELELMPRYPGGEPVESPDRVLLTAYVERSASHAGTVTVMLAYGPGTAWDAIKRSQPLPRSLDCCRVSSSPPSRGRQPLRKRSFKADAARRGRYAEDVYGGIDDDARAEHPMRRGHGTDVRHRALFRLHHERAAAWHAKRNRVLMAHEFEDDDDIENNITDSGYGGSHGRAPGSGYGSVSDTELDDSDDIDDEPFHMVTPEA